MDTLANADNGKLIEILPYEELAPDIKEQVDCVVAEFALMQYNDFIPYGWDILKNKNELVNSGLVSAEDFAFEEIDKILDSVMNARKSVMPREKSFLRKAYMPSLEEKREFVGVVGELEQAIKLQIQKMLEVNDLYTQIAFENREIVNRYAIIVMAIEKYLTSVNNTALINLLCEKRNDFKDTISANLSCMLQYVALCYSNGLAINKFYKIINTDLHILQEQLLIQTGINEIKSVLSTCDSIKSSITNLTQSNIEELKATNQNLIDYESTHKSELDVKEMFSKCEEGISLLGVAPSPCEGEVQEVNKKTSWQDYFCTIDTEKVEMVKEWLNTFERKPLSEYNLFFSTVEHAIEEFRFPYQIATRSPSINRGEDKIYFNELEEGYCARTPVYWLERVIEFKPNFNSDIATLNEFMLYCAYKFATSEWNLSEYEDRIESDFGINLLLQREGELFALNNWILGSTRKIGKYEEVGMCFSIIIVLRKLKP